MRAIAAMAIALAAAGCAGGGVQAGSAFQYPPTQTGVKPIRPGFETGLLDLFLENTSNSTLVLDSVGLSGPGMGTVMRPVTVEIAPQRFGRHTYIPEQNFVPEGLYTVTPPVVFLGNRCEKQTLVSVKGFRMTPGSQARVWIVLRAMRPGKWVIPFHVIYYTVAGVRYREAVPLREAGSVARNARYIPPDWAEAKCVGPQTGAKFLPGYHRGRVST